MEIVAVRKRFYNLSGGLFISSNISKQDLLILSCLSDFCSELFNIQRAIHISALKHGRRIKCITYVHEKLIYTKCEQCYT